MTYSISALVTIEVLQTVALIALLIRGSRNSRMQQSLRESDERFRRMIDSAPVMLWTARPDTTLDFLNQYCEEFTGLPMAKLLNEGWLDAVHPDDRELSVGTYTPAIEARRPFIFEYRVRRADGAWRWLVASGVPKYGPDGSFAGYIGCDIDITDRREAEESLRTSRNAIETSHREIQQLAGSLITAHEDERRHLARELHDDLTQRLALLAIDAGRMEDAVGAPRGMGQLHADLVRMSEDVHAMSYRLHSAVLEDLGLLEALKTECDRVARSGNLRVDVKAESVPTALPIDASLCLYRVTQEALSNASRHAHASAVTVLLTSRGTGLELAVSDNGSGFDPELSRDRASLGLASMRERVRFLQGEFNIVSAPGRGTTVMAWVPT